MKRLLSSLCILSSFAIAEVPSVSTIDNGKINIYKGNCANTGIDVSCSTPYVDGYDFKEVYMANDAQNLYFAIASCNDLRKSTIFEGDHYLYIDYKTGGAPYDLRYKLDYFRWRAGSLNSALMSVEEWDGTNWVFKNEAYQAADNGINSNGPLFDINNYASQGSVGDYAEGIQLLVSSVSDQGENLANEGAFIELKVPVTNASSIIKWKITGPIDALTNTNDQPLSYSWKTNYKTISIDANSDDWISSLGFQKARVEVIGGHFARNNSNSIDMYVGADEYLIADAPPVGKKFAFWQTSWTYIVFLASHTYTMTNYPPNGVDKYKAIYVDDPNYQSCQIGKCYANPLLLKMGDVVNLTDGGKFIKLSSAISNKNLHLQLENTGQTFNIVGEQCGQGFGTPESVLSFIPSSGPLGCDRVYLEPNGGVFSVKINGGWW